MQAPSTGTGQRAVRTDIQGLRAIAVSLVLVYHLAPHSLTGGFTGVDVFFVISGFLITLHLLERMPAHPRDLGVFWSRRVRRLLPASLLVLAVTLAGSRLVAPETQWENTARQAQAAALYVVNWLLARDAVDYLAAENAPSPVQHFWSLSVEEQFYFVWPVLILLLGLLARATRRRPLPVVLAGLTVLVAGSLAWSVHETATNPAAAYFVAPTRMWELGVGGLLATVTLLRPGRVGPWVATPFAWLGLLAVGWAGATYTGQTPFPGWQAAMPVLGTAAVIAAHPEGSRGTPGWWLSPGPLLALRPVQWLGDISYSVYLWHWPLVVLVPQATGHALTWADRGGILLATLALAWVTKLLVEDRFRTARWGVPLPKPFALAAAGMVVVVALAGMQQVEVRQRSDRAAAVLARGLAGEDPCFGSRALDHPGTCPAVAYADVVPAPIEAAQDKSDAYDNQANGTDCWSYQPRFPDKECVFGDAASTRNVVLVGNSHAGQWLPALQQIAGQHHLKITTLLASRCALADVRQEFDTAANATACLGWVHRTTQRVAALHPDLVVMSNRISIGADTSGGKSSDELYRKGYASVLRTWRDAGIRTIVLRDTPAPGQSVPDCVAEKKSSYRACDGTRSSWLPSAPEQQAVQDVGSPLVTFADLTDHICGPTTCTAVTGGVITYFDATHLTATYARTLAPYLEPIVTRALAAG